MTPIQRRFSRIFPLVLLGCPIALVGAEEPPPFVLQWGGDPVVAHWGSNGSGPGQFYFPSSVDVDGDGNVYVADQWNCRVQKFDADGQYLAQWGSCGTGPGQFNQEGFMSLAVSEGAIVYVGSGTRVQKFDSNGHLLDIWDLWLRVCDVGETGEVYTLAPGPTIQVYSEAGVLLRQWGTSGTGPGQFLHPSSVVADRDGNVYLTEWQPYRLQKFDSEGRLLAVWGSFGQGYGQFLTPGEWTPGDVAVDELGHVYVSDDANHRVQVFSTDGIFLEVWGGPIPSSALGQFDSPWGLACTPAGRFYVADRNHRVQAFDFSRGGKFQLPFDAAADAAGHVYVGDRERIQKFDGSGQFLLAWGSSGSGDGQVQVVAGLAVDPGGRVFVVDSGNHRIQKFSQGGAFLDKWGGFGSGPGSFNAPFGIAVDASAHVYVADTGNHRIQRFDDHGAFQMEWGGLGSGPGQFSSPAGVAVDPSGFVYVADLGNHRVQKFAPDGGFADEWGGFGTGPGQFDRPYDVFVDWLGGVYVADMGNDRIQKFDADGVWLASWGTSGAGPGQFESPTGICADALGNVFVLDAGNVRVQRFGSVPPAFPVALDLQPTTCPNTLNPSSRGKIPAALLGTPSFDVGTVDLSTLRLEEVVPALHPTLIDLATPSAGPCECTRAGRDGITDVSMEFETQALVEVLGSLRRGEVRDLRLSGRLLDGTPIEGRDCVLVLHDSDSAGLPLRPGTRIELVSSRDDAGRAIAYTLPAASPVHLAAYDVAGRLVTLLVDAVQPQGRHEVRWDTRGVARGVYWLRLSAGAEVASRRIVLLPRAVSAPRD